MDQVAGPIELFRGLAPMHAKYLNKTDEYDVAPIGKSFSEPFWPVVFPMMANMTWPQLQEKWKAAGLEWPGKYHEVVDGIIANVNDLTAKLGLTKERGSSFLDCTLVHGDPRLDNIFFSFNDDGTLAKDAQVKLPLIGAFDR